MHRHRGQDDFDGNSTMAMGMTAADTTVVGMTVVGHPAWENLQ